MIAVLNLVPRSSCLAACAALSVSRASFYRWRRPTVNPPVTRPKPPRALGTVEGQAVLAALHSTRFADQAPPQVYAKLLDEGTYLCSPRTMYRLLDQAGEIKERRNQLRHPAYKRPALLATAPKQLWSWDITKLRGPEKWTYFYLYVLLDVFSRYTVAWMIAPRESGNLARKMIAQAVHQQKVPRGQLTIHADNGAPMTAKLLAFKRADLGVTKSHSRPHVSNDNPYSESQFKTLKYRPEFPDRFGCIEDARLFCQSFFEWYNAAHQHSGIAWLTPQQVHYGEAPALIEQRQRTLDVAFAKNPERFVRRAPRPQPLPTAVWINPPQEASQQPEEAL